MRWRTRSLPPSTCVHATVTDTNVPRIRVSSYRSASILPMVSCGLSHFTSTMISRPLCWTLLMTGKKRQVCIVVGIVVVVDDDDDEDDDVDDDDDDDEKASLHCCC